MTALTIALDNARRRAKTMPLAGIALLIAVAGGLRAYAVGQDINFDQLNYHFYDAWAFVHGRFGLDVAPAGIQTFLNPLPYLPFYFLVRALPPAAVGVTLGAVQALSLIPVLFIAQQAAGETRSRSRFWPVLAAMLISAASPIAISELGTSFADLLLSIPILAGVAILLPVGSAHPAKWPRVVAAAFLVGIAAGLKLTNMVYSVGFAVACVLGWRSWRDRGAAMGLAALGGIAGALLSGGFWFLRLWRAFGSPTFPFYNNIFHASGFPPIALRDEQWLPKSIVKGLSYPFNWAVGTSPSAEVGFRDTRFALLIVLAVLAGMALLASGVDRDPDRLERESEIQRSRLRLIVFFGVSFVVWLFQFGYQRYAVPLELLVGPVFLCLLGILMGPRLWGVPAFAVAAFAFATIRIGDWGHTPWSKHWYGLEVPAALADDATYVLGGPTLSYIAPSFSSGARFVSIDNGFDFDAGAHNIFTQRIAARLAEGDVHDLRLVVADPLSDTARAVLGSYGLNLTDKCRAIQAHLRRLFVCDLLRTNQADPATMPVADGDRFAFDGAGNGLLILADGWSGRESWGVWGIGSDSTLLLRIDDAMKGHSLLIRAVSQAILGTSRPEATVRILAGNRQIGEWHFTLADNHDTRSVCVPADLVSDNKALLLTFRNDTPVSPEGLGINLDKRAINFGLISADVATPEEGNCMNIEKLK